MKKNLVPVIEVNEDNCVNCHMCISACPVKFCIDGSGDVVSINHDLCIGCGSCIAACTHDARIWKDDADEFFRDVERGEKIVFIVAPAIPANYPRLYRSVMGYLKSMGVPAFFDVSFGAELTVKSYLEHSKADNPKMIISQPCPAIVTYCEIYQPELLPHLAPVDSPMLHTIKMIREYYPQYNDHKVAVLSPCLAKKREFDETGMGDYNVTCKSMNSFFLDKGIDPEQYDHVEFTGPSAERAVLFSSPGGLLETVARENKDVIQRARKMEGVGTIYHYLKELPETIEKGVNPLLLDCLNCEKGCNGGPGTLNENKSIDEIEYHINKRKEEHLKKYAAVNKRRSRKKVDHVLDHYWKPDLYHRTYLDLSENNKLKIPSAVEIEEIYRSMSKHSEKDILNCASCGYNSCEQMAVAIFNGLNKVENCHLYMNHCISKEKEMILEMNQLVNKKIGVVEKQIVAINESVEEVNRSVHSQSSFFEQSVRSIEDMINRLQDIALISRDKKKTIDSLVNIARTGESHMKETEASIGQISSAVEDISRMMELIDDVAAQTNLLSMNAAIEAAHAGDSGRGFSVVANEIKKLAEHSATNARDAAQNLSNITIITDKTGAQSVKTGNTIGLMVNDINGISEVMNNLIGQIESMFSESTQVISLIGELRQQNISVLNSSDRINNTVEKLTGEIQGLFAASEKLTI